MPKLINQPPTIVAKTISSFEYSGKKVSELTATEYTLASIAIDVSPSTEPFRSQLEQALETIVTTLRKSPRAERLLVRVEEFDEALTEVHGFITLNDINPKDYKLFCSGSGTALMDATLASIEAVGSYGKELDNMDFGVNGVVFIVTDGMDNMSKKASPTIIKNRLNEIRAEKTLESLKVILIGVGEERQTEAFLTKFQTEAMLDQYIWIGNASPSSLAKMAEFISKSISAASQSLGTSDPAQNLDF